MADGDSSIKPGYYAYPTPKEGPPTEFSFIPGTNPVLRGYSLSIAGALYVMTLLSRKFGP